MSAFVAVAESGGFGRAARRLGISSPAVTRAIAMLEARIGARLFTRTTRVVRVTDAGARYLEDCRRILAELSVADRAAAGVHASPSGELAVTAPVLFGQKFVVPHLVSYLNEHPAVRIRAVFLDRIVELLDEGLDVAVRIGDLPDSSLLATRVGAVRRVVCASPAYLRERGRPAQPADLAQHQIIAATGVDKPVEWRFDGRKSPTTIQLAAPLAINSNDGRISAALAGFGLTRVLSYQVADLLADGRLVTVLDEFHPTTLPIHVVHSQGRGAAAKIRSFVDFLVPRLRADPAINSS